MKKIKNKRIKKVFTNFRDVIALWVKQSQHYACSRFIGGDEWIASSRQGETVTSCFFEGKRIFSYGTHYLLGVLDLEYKGTKFSIVNYANFSRKTSEHSWCVSRTLRDSKRLVVELYPKAGQETLNHCTSDKKLVELVLEKIKEDAFSLSELVFEYQFSTRGCYYDYLRDSIKDHNKLALAFSQEKYILEVPRDIATNIVLNQKQRRLERDSKRSRSQLCFFSYYLNRGY